MAIETYEMRRRDDGSTKLVPAPHKVFNFPGGESHVAWENATASTQVAYLTGGDSNDLMALAMWADACHRSGVKSIALIPYLPGARQDRGVPLGAKVFAEFLNSMRIDRIVCLDPHSDVMPALLDRLTVVDACELPIWKHFADRDTVGVIAPDAGARKRAESVAARLGVPVYQATKHRDFASGKLSSFSCEPLPGEGNLVMVDDICDGGGTFRGLAEVIGVKRERLGLWVTHGVFSGAADLLAEDFGFIATTDSHPGASMGHIPNLHVLPVRDFLLSKIKGI